MPPHVLLAGAKNVRACGLSLNLLCQQYPDRELRQKIEDGTQFRFLFLNPAGDSIERQEAEDGYAKGHLSSLTKLNIEVLTQLVRGRLSLAAQERLEIRLYDETTRANILLIDGRTGVFQPYLPRMRGIDSPTFLLHQSTNNDGLLAVCDQIFESLWQRGEPA